MSPLHRRDEYGRLPLLDDKRKTELMELHLALGREAEKLISSKIMSIAAQLYVKPVNATFAAKPFMLAKGTMMLL